MKENYILKNFLYGSECKFENIIIDLIGGEILGGGSS